MWRQCGPTQICSWKKEQRVGPQRTSLICGTNCLMVGAQNSAWRERARREHPFCSWSHRCCVVSIWNRDLHLEGTLWCVSMWNSGTPVIKHLERFPEFWFFLGRCYSCLREKAPSPHMLGWLQEDVSVLISRAGSPCKCSVLGNQCARPAGLVVLPSWLLVKFRARAAFRCFLECGRAALCSESVRLRGSKKGP